MEKNLPEQLQAQLHDQYAKSDNEKSARIVSFIGSTSFVLTGYGFVIWNYDCCHNKYLVSITLAVCMVLSLLAWLCVNFGYTLRRDQFIMQRIRQNAMEGDYDKIFGDQFNPFGKCLLTYMIGYYTIIFFFLNMVIIGVYVTSLCITEDCFLKSSIVINFIANVVYYIYYYCKYQKIEESYRKSKLS